MPSLSPTGSLLTMNRTAVGGTLYTREFAGATVRLVPTTMSRSTVGMSSTTRRKNSSGKLERNKTMAGLTPAYVQVLQGMRLDSSGALASCLDMSLMFLRTSSQNWP